jgi:MFS family permease
MPAPLLVATSISASLAMGLVSVFFQTVQDHLRERLGVSEDRLARLRKLLIFSLVPLMPMAGSLVDHWGLHPTLFTGSLVLGLAVSWLAVCRNLPSLLWGVLGLGFAGACVTVAGVSLMPAALRLAPRWSVGAALCLGYVFVGLASLLTPRFVQWTAGRLGFRRVVLFLGLLCLLPGTLAALANAEIPQPAPVLESSPFDVRFWLIALSAFLYFPVERSLQIWPRPYLAEIGYTDRSVVRLLVGFWVAFLVFRFGLAWMIREGNEAVLIFVLLVVSSMIMGNLAGAYAPSSGYFGFWLIGACYGPLMPALLAILLDVESPRGIPGQALGFFFALGALNALLVQPVVVAFAKRHPPRVVMRIPMLLALATAAPVLALGLIRFMK